jgi:GTP cyclohydrolase I
VQLNKNVYLCNQTLIQNTMSKKYTVNKTEIKAVQTLLKSIGQDVTREGLIDTPKRYVKFLKEFCTPEPFNMTTFENEGSTNEMIIVSNVPFFSLCEHHLAPFFGTAAIAYIPNDKIVGLSKLPRTLDMFSRRPQNQERITQQVADYLMEQLQPKGVAVVIKARHLCVEMRGVKKHDTYTTTSSMKGVFYDELNTRQEFLNLIK